MCVINEDDAEQSSFFYRSVTYLFQFINPLCGLDSDLEETQYPSHNVYNSVRNLSRGADVTNVSAGVVKHEGFDELGGKTSGELWGGNKTVFPREAVELLEGQI